MAVIDQTKTAARGWLKREQRAGMKLARPVVMLGLLGTLLAIGQAISAAKVLTGDQVPLALGGFAVCAILRAALGFASERAGFEAGAAARRGTNGRVIGQMVIELALRDLLGGA